MTTKTARFEIVNPYQKYGLKRKPTFNEILGLLSEDQKLLRPFPDRTATQFRNSPQGSFFDGSDHVELLKEQQNRVLDRQMREMILRRQAQQNGGTFHLNRHNDSFTSEQSVSDSGMMTPSDVSSSQIIYHADAQRELEQRARGLAQRQQEVGQRHGEAVNRLNDTLTRNMLRSGFNDLRGMPESEPLQDDVSEEELIPAEDDQLTTYQRGVFNFDNDASKIMLNNDITFDDLMFQLFYRDLLTDEIKEQVNDEPNEIRKKKFLSGIIQGMMNDGRWSVLANPRKLKSKQNEWKSMKRNQASSSSGGLVRQFLASAGSSVLEAGKEVAKEVAIRGARSALGV